jgi:ectoine hydroxylase-related dioxygenase (phytanoyl-CoA dioxygenase family)
MVDRSSPTAATTGPAAGRLSKLHLHICSAVAATGTDTGLHGLSEHERYFFETKGYLVVPDMLTPAQVDRMNEAIDQCPQLCRRRDWSDARGKLSADSSALVGRHSRADTGELMEWPEPHCDPFRELLSHPRTAKIMLDLVGEGFHHHTANGIIMDAGAEGHTLHGGGGGPGRRPAWTYTCQNGVIECNLITVMYQLADINPGDGGLVCIPGSHKAAFPCPRPIATLEARGEFDGPFSGAMYEHVAAKKGAAIVFTEALTHGALPWVASHQRRTLLYRYAARGFDASSHSPDTKSAIERAQSFRSDLNPLGQAILEPPGYGNRPDIAALVAQEAEKNGACR